MVAGEARAVHSLEYQGSLMNNQMKQQQQQQHHYYTGDFLLGFFYFKRKNISPPAGIFTFPSAKGAPLRSHFEPKNGGKFQMRFF